MMENPYCKNNAKNWLEDKIESGQITQKQRKDMFPGLTSDACANVPGGIAKSGNYDQVTFDNQMASYVAETGQPCWFYPYLFQEEKMEELTGEHNSAGYGRPFELLIVLEIKDSPSWVSQLGIENDATVTGWIHIRSFKDKIKPILNNQDDSRYVDYGSIYCLNPWEHNAYMKKIQPKPKDCFQVLTSACDREWDRGANIWEITNVEEQIWSEKLNLSQGHYVWKITAKRYRYSFEYGMSKLDEVSSDNPMLGEMGEKGNHQVYENDIVKMYLKASKLVYEEDIMTSLEVQDSNEEIFAEEAEVQTVHYDRKYSQDQVCEDAKKEVFDMEKNVNGFYQHVDSGGFF